MSPGLTSWCWYANTTSWARSASSRGFILADDIIKSLGFAVDALLVRMTIVPAVLSLLGRSAWWLPRWLARILPSVDVEGERPAEQLAGERSPAADRRGLDSVVAGLGGTADQP